MNVEMMLELISTIERLLSATCDLDDSSEYQAIIDIMLDAIICTYRRNDWSSLEAVLNDANSIIENL
jgi:hypothetical protein